MAFQYLNSCLRGDNVLSVFRCEPSQWCTDRADQNWYAESRAEQLLVPVERGEGLRVLAVTVWQNDATKPYPQLDCLIRLDSTMLFQLLDLTIEISMENATGWENSSDGHGNDEVGPVSGFLTGCRRCFLLRRLWISWSPR